MSLTETQRALLRTAFGDRRLAVTRLSGGLHGRCYRVSGERFDYAVRMPGPNQGSYRLDSGAEQRVLGQVATAGLAPPVIPTAPELGLVATKFLSEAHTWSAGDARQTTNIDRLARRLNTLHAMELELEPFASVAVADAYARAACERTTLKLEQRRWRDDFLRLASSFEASFPAAVPCHNDLVASNILDDGELWLVDFEYATQSAPILDLAGLAGLNAFDAAESSRLVSAYYADERPPFGADDLDAAIRLVRLLAYFWVLAYDTPEASTADFADALAAMLR